MLCAPECQRVKLDLPSGEVLAGHFGHAKFKANRSPRSLPANADKMIVLSRMSTDEGLPDLPGFTIEELLGEGTFGRVYRAVQKSLSRPVALKIGKSVPNVDESLEREVHRLSRLRHPDIVQVFEAVFAQRKDRWVAVQLLMENYRFERGDVGNTEEDLFQLVARKLKGK